MSSTSSTSSKNSTVGFILNAYASAVAKDCSIRSSSSTSESKCKLEHLRQASQQNVFSQQSSNEFSAKRSVFAAGRGSSFFSSSKNLKGFGFPVVPRQDVQPLHCSGSNGATVAISTSPTTTKIVLPTNEQSENLLRIRHSCAHIMAMAVQKLFPQAQVTIGPWIENGFYYDFDCATPFSDSDLKSIKKEMIKIMKKKLPITCEAVTREEARERIEKIGEKYKLEILDNIPGDDITIYSIGNEWWDLCAGPHVEKTSDISEKAFELESVAGAYWRGDEKNAQLQRIYGTAWESPDQLQAYQKMREEAKRRDHRKLGQELDLFSIQQDDAGGGLVFWHPKGAMMRNLIESYWKQVHLEGGYELLYTPHMANLDLWKTSGHLDFYRESMFNAMEVDEQQYQIKPMNCPFHCLIFKDGMRSYRELPKRWAELGTVYRYERSGTLHGLFRVRGFTQDDAHVFCLPDQIATEIRLVLDLVEKVLSHFGFKTFEVNLSTRPEKSVGSDEIWERATEALKEALAAKDWAYTEDVGGGAFYGPKIDIKIEDAIGRKWQCSTIQCDFNLPERFDLEYTASDGTRQRPIMVHRAIFGSLERFFGILVENYAGDFPLWLAPMQARVIPVTDAHRDYAHELVQKMRARGLRAEVDSSGERLGKAIRNAEKLKIPVMCVVGNSEVAEGKVNVRIRAPREDKDEKAGEIGSISGDELITHMLEAIARHQTIDDYFSTVNTARPAVPVSANGVSQ